MTPRGPCQPRPFCDSVILGVLLAPAAMSSLKEQVKYEFLQNSSGKGQNDVIRQFKFIKRSSCLLPRKLCRQRSGAHEGQTWRGRCAGDTIKHASRLNWQEREWRRLVDEFGTRGWNSTPKFDAASELGAGERSPSFGCEWWTRRKERTCLSSGSALLGVFSCVSVRLLGLGVCHASRCHAREASTFFRRVAVKTPRMKP